MNNKALIYARVSSNEQEETGYSLPAQEKLLTEYAARKDLVVVKVFAVAESASGAKQRQEFTQMMEYAHKEGVTNLLVEKVDRLTRNLKDAVIANEWVDENEERRIHFVKQNLVIHKNAKSDEKFRWDIEIVLAKKYIANLSEEVKKGQKEKLAQGWLPTKPPIGYKTIGDKGKKIHIIDPDHAPFVKKLYEYYASGNYSMKAVIDKLYDDGFRTKAGGKMVKSRVEDILCDPFYYGAMRWKDLIYEKGRHEPIVSKELFDKVQEVRTGRKTPYKARHKFIFSKMINCGECGGTITAEVQKGITYYHCNHYRNCLQKEYAPEKVVEEQVLKYFEVFESITQEEADEIARRIKADHAEEIKYKENAIQSLQERYNRLQKRVEVLYEDRLDEKISTQFWENKKAEIDKEQVEIQNDLKRIKNEETKYYEIGINILDLARRAKEIYLKRTPEEKRLLLNCLFSNMSLLGKVLTPKPKEAIEKLSKRIKEKLERQKNFELKNTLVNKAKIEKGVDSEFVLRR